MFVFLGIAQISKIPYTRVEILSVFSQWFDYLQLCVLACLNLFYLVHFLSQTCHHCHVPICQRLILASPQTGTCLPLSSFPDVPGPYYNPKTLSLGNLKIFKVPDYLPIYGILTGEDSVWTFHRCNLIQFPPPAPPGGTEAP